MSFMPGAFAPSLPSLPSYPRGSSAASSSFSHPKKRPHTHSSSTQSRSSNSTHVTTPYVSTPYTDHFTSYDPTSYNTAPQSSYSSAHNLDRIDTNVCSSPYTYSNPPLSPALTPPPLSYASDDDDDDGMTSSFYSDRQYRSALTASTSRKRGFDDADSDSDRRSSRPCDDRGGKRRILDVVGGTMAGVVRGVWEFCRPRWGIPFVGLTRRETAPARTPETPQRVPGDWGSRQSSYSSYSTTRSSSFGFGGLGGLGIGLGISNPSSQSTPNLNSRSNTFDSADIGAGSPRPRSSRSARSERASRRDRMSLADGSPPPMSARWVMVSPQQPPTPSPNRTRRPRPATSAKKRIRPSLPRGGSLNSHSTFGGTYSTGGMHSPPSSAGSSSGLATGWGGVGASGGKKHRRGPSREEEEDDADIRRLNEKLKAMIREGREALGSTVEVVYDDEDEFMMAF